MARFQVQVTKSAVSGAHSAANTAETVGSGDFVVSFDAAKFSTMNLLREAVAAFLARMAGSNAVSGS